MSAKEKGKSLLVFPEDYTVVDIETTGLCAGKSEIIEISAVKFRGRREEGSFSTLVKPSRPVGYFITRLTGITFVGFPEDIAGLTGDDVVVTLDFSNVRLTQGEQQVRAAISLNNGATAWAVGVYYLPVTATAAGPLGG